MSVISLICLILLASIASGFLGLGIAFAISCRMNDKHVKTLAKEYAEEFPILNHQGELDEYWDNEKEYVSKHLGYDPVWFVRFVENLKTKSQWISTPVFIALLVVILV